MRKARKIIMLEKKDNSIVKRFKNIRCAEKYTGVPHQTIYSQCHDKLMGTKDFYFRFDEEQRGEIHKNEPVVELTLDGEYVKTYNTQIEVATEKGISYQLVNHYLRGRSTPKDYKLVYQSDYKNNKQEQKEIVKQKNKEYFVNVLVGLANQTLVDGATYEIDETKYVYDKQSDSLKVNGQSFYTRQKMFEEVNVEMPLLLPEERKFLKTLLQAFSNVRGIVKYKDRRDGFEYIMINTSSEEDSITLPSFKEGKYYTNLKQNTLYTIEQLDLS